jgi:hypothetical protein
MEVIGGGFEARASSIDETVEVNEVGPLVGAELYSWP